MTTKLRKVRAMTPSELKYRVEEAGLLHYFDRRTMKFWGDTMKNYGCRKVTCIARFDADGNFSEEGFEREAWELYRKHPVKNNYQASAYFDCLTFKVIHSVKG